jgi:hypothetical protein
MNSEHSTETQKLYSVIMILAILVIHGCAFCTFGATYWIDSLAYVSLGDALFDPGKLKHFYDGIGRWSYSYLGPGLPLLWSGMKLFPTMWEWPLLAIFQHAIAVGSCLLAFVWAIRPSALGLCAVIILSLLPFYQSGHQMLMTESLSASLLLIAAALTIRLTTRRWSEALFWLLLTILIFATQFRSYFGLIVAALAGIVLVQTGKWRSGRSIVLAAVFLGSVLVFPVYRYFSIGELFMPSFGTNRLVWSLWADPKPSNELVQVFEESDLPPDYPARDILSKGLDYVDVSRIASHWKEKGLTDVQIDQRARKIGARVLTDGPWPTINRVLYGLNSCGFTFPYKLGPAGYEVFRGKSMDAEWKHQLAYYRWFSWIDSAEYRGSFNLFFRAAQPHIPSSVNSQEEMIAALEPYLKDPVTYVRDPLFLGLIYIDIWSLLGAAGILLLFLGREFGLATVFVIPVAINFAATGAAGVPNVRYAYGLIPIYFLAIVVGMQTFRSKIAPIWDRRTPTRGEAEI